MDYTTLAQVHRSHLILFQVYVSASTKEVVTTLKTSVFKYSQFNKSFEKLFGHDEFLTVTLKGKWNGISSKNVSCDSTGVMQPCVLLKQCMGNSKSSLRLALYQLIDLNKLDGFKVKVPYQTCPTGKSWSNRNIHIVNGPLLLYFDIEANYLFYIMKNSSLNKVSLTSLPIASTQPFLLKCRQKSGTEATFTFVGVRPCDREHKLPRWIEIIVSVGKEFVEHPMTVECEDTNLPSVYCSFVTAISLWDSALDDCATNFLLMGTKRCQLLLISGSIVDKICDIPLSHCDAIEVVGRNENSVAILSDKNETRLCAVNLATFKVVKIWDKVVCMTKGNIVHNGDVHENILVLRSKPITHVINSDDYIRISSTEDVLIDRGDHFQDFPLRFQTENTPDPECDMFSSSLSGTNESEQCEEALNKVIKVLGHTVNKHKSAIDSLRSSLQHKDQVLYLTKKSLLEMNHNIILDSSVKNVKENGNSLVDLFTAESRCMKSHCVFSNTFLKVKKIWQRIVYDQWIIGLTLTNLSSKFLDHFAIMLLPSSQASDDLQFTSTYSKIQTKRFILKNLLKKSSHNNHNIHQRTEQDCLYQMSSESNTENTANAIVQPEEVFVVGRTLVPLSAELLGMLRCNHIILIAIASDVVNDAINHSDVCNETYIFHVGKVSLSATDLATGVLVVEPDLMINQDYDKICEDVAAVKCCHLHQSTLVLSSYTVDVVASCQAVFQSMYLTYSEKLSFYICKQKGPFYQAIVEMIIFTKRRVDLNLSCRSAAEELLLISYMHEQIPNDLQITPKRIENLTKPIKFQ